MKLKFVFNVLIIILFSEILASEEQEKFVFETLPGVVKAKIVEHSEESLVLSTYIAENFDVLKPKEIRKIAKNILRQNIFNGKFATFDDLDESIKKEYPIILRNNATFKNIYNNNRILFFLRYAPLEYLNKSRIMYRLPTIEVQDNTFETNEKQTYTIKQLMYKKNNEIMHQMIRIPHFNVTSDSAWQNIKKLINEFPKLERIIVNDIQIKENEIEKNYPLNHGNIIIQRYKPREWDSQGDVIFYDNNGNTILHFKDLKYITFKLLLKNKVDSNVPNGAGETSLYIASREGKLDIVKLLLEYGADPYFENYFGTPIHVTMWKYYHEYSGEILVKFWLENYPIAKTYASMYKIKFKNPIPEVKFLDKYKILMASILGIGSIFGLLKLKQHYPTIKDLFFKKR